MLNPIDFESHARDFLRQLDGAGIYTFQTFDDDSTRKRMFLARVLHGTFDQHEKALSDLNSQGSGIFVMVNEGDLKGRAATNVQRVRALFVDLDGAPLEPALQCALPPHIVVDSSKNRYHAYWLVSDCPLQEFRGLQQALARKFGGDASVIDLPRVMRLPGFFHQKSEPTKTTLRSVDQRAPYTVAQLVDRLELMVPLHPMNAGATGGIDAGIDPNAPCEEGQRNNRLTSLAGRWLGEGKAQEEVIALARAWNAKLASPLPDTEVDSVCASMRQTHERNHPQQTHSIAISPLELPDWDEPIPFAEYATPEIPASLLPGELGKFAAELASSTETPEAMAVFAVLGTLSTALAKRFVVSPMLGWNEPVNIYALVALPPGNNKSLVLKRCTDPLREWEIEQAFLLGPELKRLSSERINQEKLIESLRGKAVKAKNPDERASLFREINDLEAKLPETKQLPQLFANDSTPESLAQSVHEQGGRFAVISDEGGITETLSGLYTGGMANIDLILKGIDGGELRVRRQARSLDLQPFLTFMLTVQPAIVQRMGDRRAFQGNGLLERFLYVLPQSKLGHRTFDTAPLPENVRAAYARAIRGLLDIPPNWDERGREIPRILTLSSEARSMFQELRSGIEKELRPGGELHGCLGWGGKLPGYTLRLAGLLHVAEHAERSRTISLATMARAVSIALIVRHHARAAFNLMGIDQSAEDAKAVLEWIRSRREYMFRKTECHRALHGRFTKVPRLNEALKGLMDRNMVSGPVSLPTTPGKRPTAYYRVNPAVLGVA